MSPGPKRLVCVLAVLVCVACSRGSAPASAPVPAGDEASYFFEHREKLQAADPNLAGVLQVGLASFAQPAGRAVKPGDPTLTLGLSISYLGAGPEIVILDVIPWRVGDIEKGPGARLRKTARYGLSLKAGERGSIDVPVAVERVGEAAPSATAPAPSPTPAPPRSRLRGTGTGLLALVGEEPSPSPFPEPSPSPAVLPRPTPAGTPAGPTIPPQKGGPFDPEAGVQVILVAAFVGPGIASDAYKSVSLVPPDQFAAAFAGYSRVEQGIPVPIDRIL